MSMKGRTASGQSNDLLLMLTTTALLTVLMQLLRFALWLSAPEPKPGFLSRTKHTAVRSEFMAWEPVLQTALQHSKDHNKHLICFC